MKYTTLFLILLHTCWLGGQSWETYSLDDDRFSVSVPDTLQYKSNKLVTDVGVVTLHSYYFQDEREQADNHLYLINYFEYPEGTFHPDSLNVIEELFQTSISQSEEDLQGTLVYSNSMNHKTHPGYLWRVNYGDAVMKAEAYLVGDRFYCFQVFMPSKKSMNRSADKFFDSFYLKKL